jgi:uncharacterized protein (TIGR03067 family)
MPLPRPDALALPQPPEVSNEAQKTGQAADEKSSGKLPTSQAVRNARKASNYRRYMARDRPTSLAKWVVGILVAVALAWYCLSGRGGDAQRLAGEWTCISDSMNGKPTTTHYHRSWTFVADRVTINGDRRLWYRLDERASPKRLHIYNRVASAREFHIYACIYRLEGNNLIVRCKVGDRPPDDFGPEGIDQFSLTFVR